jgi:DNA-binding transcriptional regulator GbsR (MarR family)
MAIYTMEERHFIEDIGLFFEQMGLPRMAGRVMGVLLISDPPAQSLTELAEALQASKSAVSTAARLLVEAGLIEQVPSPIPRRDYFRFKPGGWMLFIRQRFEVITALHQITERGLGLLQEKNTNLQERLQEAHDLFSFIESEAPTFAKRWKEQQRILKTQADEKKQ